MVTPGNHDVNRKTVDDNSLIKLLHDRLRTCQPEDIDKEIREIMLNSDNPDYIFKTIETYVSDCATAYGCQIDPADPFWEKDFYLNDGSTLRFRGINSTLVSDRYDDDVAHKLVIGKTQATPQRHKGVAYSIVCHHPPTWLREQDDLEKLWNNRVALQFFGHKHRKRIRLEDNRTLIIEAGATHPSREESYWEPFYSMLKLKVVQIENQRKLDIQILPRIWDPDKHTFVSYNDRNDNSVWHRQLDLDQWPTKKTNDDQPYKVFIADDFFAVRDGLRTTINTLDGFVVVGEAASIKDIFIQTDRLRPDIIILDLKWFDDLTAGQSIIPDLKREYPDMKFIAITAHEELLETAKNVGANEGLTKTFSKIQIAETLIKVAQE